MNLSLNASHSPSVTKSKPATSDRPSVVVAPASGLPPMRSDDATRRVRLRSLGDYTHAELMQRVRYLEGVLDEAENETTRYENAFTTLRACEDKNCGPLCAHCVTALFRTDGPGEPPRRIPEKHNRPWRK